MGSDSDSDTGAFSRKPDPDFKQSYLAWTARGTKNVNALLRDQGQAWYDALKAFEISVKTLADDQILHLEEGWDINDILQRFVVDKQRYDKLTKDERLAEMQKELPEPFLEMVTSLCKDAIAQHDLDVSEWIAPQAKEWMAHYDTDYNRLERYCDKLTAQCLQYHNDLGDTERRSLDRENELERSFARKRTAWEDWKKSQKEELKVWQAKVKALEDANDGVKALQGSVTPGDELAQKARDEANLRQQADEEALRQSEGQIRRLKEDLAEAHAMNTAMASATEELRTDNEDLQNRLKISRDEQGQMAKHKAKAIELETNVEELQSKIEKNDAEQLRARDAATHGLGIRTPTSSAEATYETPTTLVEIPSLMWSASTALSSTPPTLPPSPTRKPKQLPARHPYAELICPVLQQIAIYRRYNEFPPYHKISEDYTLNKSDVLASLGVLLSHFDHNCSTPTDELNVKDNVILALKHWLSNPANGPAWTRQDVDDSVSKVLNTFEWENKMMLVRQNESEAKARDGLSAAQERLGNANMKIKKEEEHYEHDSEQTKRLLTYQYKTEDDLQKENHGLQNYIEEHEKVCEAQTAGLRSNLEDLERERDELQRALEDRGANVPVAGDKTEKLEANIKEAQSMIDDLKEQAAALGAERQALAQRLIDQEKFLEQKESNVKGLELERKHLLEDRDIVAEEAEKELQGEADKLQLKDREIEALDTTIRNLTKEIEDLKHQAVVVEKESEELKSQISAIENKLEASEAASTGAKKAMDSNMDLYEKDLKDIQGKLDAAEADRDEMAQRYELLDDYHHQLQERFDEHRMESGGGHDCTCSACKDHVSKALAFGRKALAQMKGVQAQLLHIRKKEREWSTKDEGADLLDPDEYGERQREIQGLEGPYDEYRVEGGVATTRLAQLEEELATERARAEAEEKQLEQALDIGKRLFKFYRRTQAVLKKYRTGKEKLCRTPMSYNPNFMEDMDIYLEADKRRLETRRDDLIREIAATSWEDSTQEQEEHLVKVRGEIEKYTGILAEINLHSTLADEALVASEQYHLDPDMCHVQRLLDDEQESVDSPVAVTPSAGPATTAVVPVPTEPLRLFHWWLCLLRLSVMLFLYGFMAQQGQKMKWSVPNEFSRAFWVDQLRDGGTFSWVHLAIFILLNTRAVYRRGR